jgi:hypothetical protein
MPNNADGIKRVDKWRYAMSPDTKETYNAYFLKLKSIRSLQREIFDS